MKQIMKKSLSMLMALLMIVSLFAGISIQTDAATVNYQYGSTSKYSNIIKNWGTREEEATFLSPNAIAFYQGTSYKTLAAKAGSSDLDKVSTSALYNELNLLMKNAHKKNNSYEDTKTLMAFTDIQSNGSPSNKISALYSGGEVGPAWDSGATWNREHTWPNSKGGASSNDGGGVNEVDIMMIRPETASNNSSRGNKAYGVSGGFYYPNLPGSPYDVRGDVARTVLYVYVRWGTEEQEVLNNMWGADGVIESKEVLLTWMAEDPVDTWEMGRNDSVQSITGTRNVFVDYPELAFELFEVPVPEDMVTPSGSASGECDHNETPTVIPPTLTQWGYTQLYCSKCNEDLGIEDEVKPLTSIESWSLTLGDDVSVNFQVDVRASIKDTAKIHLTTVSGTTIYSVSELTPVEGDIYHISVKLSAMQMIDGISVKIVNGAESTEVKTYSVRAYADTILSGNYDEATKAMVRAMLHYGAAAQTYFGYKADTLVNAGMDAPATTVPTVAKAPTYTGSVEGITYTGATLVLRDKIAVRYYFDVDGELSDYTFTKDAIACTPEKKGDGYYIEVADINPQDLENSYTVKVNDGLTVVYSPMNYIVNMYKNGSEKLQALMLATYAYYQAAEAYMPE